MCFQHSRVEIFIGSLFTHSCYSNATRTLKVFLKFSVEQQITKFVDKTYGRETFSILVKNSCAGNTFNVCKSCTL